MCYCTHNTWTPTLCLQSDGVVFDTPHGRQCFRGTLAVGSADNLASQLLGGYKALAGALRKRRICMAVFETMQTLVRTESIDCRLYVTRFATVLQFTAEEFALRTRTTHNMHCKGLTGAAKEHMATAYGVSSNSILNSSRYFHVVDGLCADIMHDVLEGALPYETKLLLCHCIQNGYFTLQVFNARMRSFSYGHDARDKPAQISVSTLCALDNKLKQSVTLMYWYYLARHLGEPCLKHHRCGIWDGIYPSW